MGHRIVHALHCSLYECCRLLQSGSARTDPYQDTDSLSLHVVALAPESRNKTLLAGSQLRTAARTHSDSICPHRCNRSILGPSEGRRDLNSVWQSPPILSPLKILVVDWLTNQSVMSAPPTSLIGYPHTLDLYPIRMRHVRYLYLPSLVNVKLFARPVKMSSSTVNTHTTTRIQYSDRRQPEVESGVKPRLGGVLRIMNVINHSRSITV